MLFFESGSVINGLWTWWFCEQEIHGGTLCVGGIKHHHPEHPEFKYWDWIGLSSYHFTFLVSCSFFTSLSIFYFELLCSWPLNCCGCRWQRNIIQTFMYWQVRFNFLLQAITVYPLVLFVCFRTTVERWQRKVLIFANDSFSLSILPFTWVKDKAVVFSHFSALSFLVFLSANLISVFQLLFFCFFFLMVPHGCGRRTIHLNCGSDCPNPSISWRAFFLLPLFLLPFFFSCHLWENGCLVLQIMLRPFRLNMKAVVRKRFLIQFHGSLCDCHMLPLIFY